MAYFLGIDIGGTLIKSGLYDEHGKEKAVAAQADPAIAGPVGWSERDMDSMWKTVAGTIRQVIAESGVSPDAIKGVSFSAHGKGLYATDKNGEPVRNGIISSDNRATPLVRRLKQEGIDKATYPYGYEQLWPCHPAVLLAWLKENESDAYARIDRILMGHDWIRYRLTGDFSAEVTNISGSNLFDIDKNDFKIIIV